MRISHHGGGCCGVQHLHEFNTPITEHNIKEFKLRLSNAINSSDNRDEEESREVGVLIEAVLTENQEYDWKKILEEHGFNAVTSFINVNSGNECTVYHAFKEIG
jgi:Fe-S cluster assembly iron-binding protein IscA